MALIVALGFAAGAAIAVVTALLEHSRVAFGGYALYGNGALILPALLSPWAMYWGWTWVLSRGGRALEMALFVVGLHFGIGLWGVIDVVAWPQETGLTVADALPSLLLTGTLFVIPAALLAALSYRLFTSRLAITPVTLLAAGFIAAVLSVLYWIGLGILTGLCVAAARRDASRRVRIGIALLVLLVVLGNLPYFPALFAGG